MSNPHISSGYLYTLTFPFTSMRHNAHVLHACACSNRWRESKGNRNQALLIPGSLHAQWREDDVKPWRKCPHLRQSSCVCPSRLTAQDHPFKHPSTPLLLCCLPLPFTFSYSEVWPMTPSRTIHHHSTWWQQSPPAVNARATVWCKIKICPNTYEIYLNVYVLCAYMYFTNKRNCLNIKEGRNANFNLLWSQSRCSWKIKALTSSTKISKVVWSPGAAVDRQAGRWPRIG